MYSYGKCGNIRVYNIYEIATMGLQDIKQKAKVLKSSAKESSRSALSYGKEKLATSRFMLDDMDKVEGFIDMSLDSDFINKKSWEEKVFKHKIIIIFLDVKSDFFTRMLYQFPILITKAFSQNIALKLADIRMSGLNKKDYGISSGPSLVLIENKKVLKVIEGEENIQKVVKTLNLDINKSIDTL